MNAWVTYFRSRTARAALFMAALAAVVVVSTQPAHAAPRTITGGETRLEVNVTTFVQMFSDGIFATPIAPATLEFGAAPAAIFPVQPPGAVDTETTLAAVVHQGGLRLEKQSIGVRARQHELHDPVHQPHVVPPARHRQSAHCRPRWRR